MAAANAKLLAQRAAQTRLKRAHADEYRALLHEEMVAHGVEGMACRVCGVITYHASSRGNGEATACPGQCKAIWHSLRLHLPGYREKHRPLTWKNDLKSDDPVRRRSAEKMLNGTGTTHGRWFVEGSIAWQAACFAYSHDYPIFKELDERLQDQIRTTVDSLREASAS